MSNDSTFWQDTAGLYQRKLQNGKVVLIRSVDDRNVLQMIFMFCSLLWRWKGSLHASMLGTMKKRIHLLEKSVLFHVLAWSSKPSK